MFSVLSLVHKVYRRNLDFQIYRNSISSRNKILGIVIYCLTFLGLFLLGTKIKNSQIVELDIMRLLTLNSWSITSPDLDTLDFFLWGKLKEEIYQQQLTTPKNMMNRIINACAATLPETIECITICNCSC